MPSSAKKRGRQKTNGQIQHDAVMTLTADDLAGSDSSLTKPEPREHKSDCEEDEESTSIQDNDEMAEKGDDVVNKIDGLFTASGCSNTPQIEQASPETTPKAQKTHKWKSFKTYIKEKVTPKRKKKNVVKEISIKPEGICEETGKLECWTVDRRDSWRENSTLSSKQENGSSLHPTESDQRNGSARSMRSSDACQSEYDDDGIETIYDAKYQENL